MTDGTLILQLAKALREDPDKPVLDQKFNPTDPVSIEIVMHEADYCVENYMKEKWEPIWRPRFSDPTVYDAFVLEYQMKVRGNLKQVIGEAQRYIHDEVENEDGEREN